MSTEEDDQPETWHVICEDCGLHVEGMTELNAERYASQHRDETCDPMVATECSCPPGRPCFEPCSLMATWAEQDLMREAQR